MLSFLTSFSESKFNLSSVDCDVKTPILQFNNFQVLYI